MDAQLQIRQNAQEVQDYMKTLFDWEEQQKKKDGQLKRGRLPDQLKQKQPTASSAAAPSAPAPRRSDALSDRALPPVRGRASGEINQAPSSLQQPAPQFAKQQNQPQAARPRKRKVKQTANTTSAANAAAHTYQNYRTKWEQFDVDAALAEASEESGSESDEAEATPSGRQAANAPSSPASSTPSAAVPLPGAALPPIRRAPQQADRTIAEAEAWKTQGNEHFKAGEYSEAIAAYSKSLELHPNCVAYANRAMAALKLDHHGQAEADCTAAIGLDATYLKAWQRRGAARKALGRSLEALEDFEHALRLQPGSKALADDRAACVALVLAEEQLQPLQQGKLVPVRQAAKPLLPATPAAVAQAPGRATPAARQAGELASVPVMPPTTQHPPALTPAGASSSKSKETRSPKQSPSSEAGPTAAESGRQQAAEPARPTSEPPSSQPLSASSPAAAAAATPASATSRLPGGVKPDAALSQQDSHQHSVPQSPVQAKPAHGIGEQRQHSPDSRRANGVQASPSTSGRPAVHDPTAGAAAASSAQSSPGKSPDTAAAISAAAAAAAEQVRRQTSSTYTAPRTATDFERAWKGLKGDAALQTQYLQQLQAFHLPSIFKQSLTAPVLRSIVQRALSGVAAVDPEQAVALLEGLSQVPRFDMTLMCLPSRDKAALRSEWDAVGSLMDMDSPLTASFMALRKRFRL